MDGFSSMIHNFSPIVGTTRIDLDHVSMARQEDALRGIRAGSPKARKKESRAELAEVEYASAIGR